MNAKRQTFNTIFLIVSVLATIFVVIEIVMQSFGKSICVTEGCRMTAQYARFGDISILLAGLATFSSIAALSLLNRRVRKAGIERLINLILIVALTGEGFFMGFLAFKIHTLCVFCVTVFCIMMTLGILRVLSGERETAVGFATLAAVFLMHYLILPAGATAELPAHDRLVLFYSKDCRHCAEIIRELDEKKLAVTHLPVSEYGGFLKNVGIEYIPTLLVNDPNEKVFLTGKEMIRRYLQSCTEANNTGEKTVQKKPARKAAASAPRDAGATLDIFSHPGLLTMPSPSEPGAGICREEEVCK